MAEPHYAPNKSPKAAVLAEDHRRSSWRMDSRTTETEERGVENPRIPLFSQLPRDQKNYGVEVHSKILRQTSPRGRLPSLERVTTGRSGVA